MAAVSPRLLRPQLLLARGPALRVERRLPAVGGARVVVCLLQDMPLKVPFLFALLVQLVLLASKLLLLHLQRELLACQAALFRERLLRLHLRLAALLELALLLLLAQLLLLSPFFGVALCLLVLFLA